MVVKQLVDEGHEVIYYTNRQYYEHVKGHTGADVRVIIYA